MRVLETSFATLLMLAGAFLISGRSARLGLGLWCLPLAALFFHVFKEGPRLQAAPAYLAVVVVFVSLAGQFSRPARITAALLGCACCGIGLVACYAFPVIKFSEPAGQFPIGTATFYLTDGSRPEKYLEGAGAKRRVATQVWYPATACTGAAAGYRDPRTLTWKSGHLRYVKTHACVHAPFATPLERRPVVFFSPSSGGYRSQNTFLTEFLVSHGYIVVGLDHPGTSSRISFPDGYIARSLQDGWLNLASNAALARSQPKAEDILRTNVQDIQFVYERLRDGTSDPRLEALGRQIDFSRVAAIGHSYGGAAAAELCRSDVRFHAGINLDGWMFTNVIAQGVPKPFLFFIEDDPLWFRNEGPYSDDLDGVIRRCTLEYHESIRRSVKNWGGGVARLVGGNHNNFADMALYRRPWPWNASENVAPERYHEVIKRIVLAFLDQHLKGKDGELFRVGADIGRYCELKWHPNPSAPTPSGECAYQERSL